jgi:hypothetical protein
MHEVGPDWGNHDGPSSCIPTMGPHWGNPDGPSSCIPNSHHHQFVPPSTTLIDC